MSDPLRVLYVGTLPPHPGGSGICCGLIVAELARRGHDVRALAPMAKDAPDPDAFRAQNLRLRIARYEVSYFLNNPYVVIPQDYRDQEHAAIHRVLPTLVEGWRPDVLMIGRESFLWHVVDFADAQGLASVLIIHGGPSTAIRDGLYAPELVDEYLGLCRRITMITTPARHWQQVVRGIGLPETTVIPNPVDPSRFRPRLDAAPLRRQLEIDAGAPVVLHASNLKPIKRPLDVVHSAAQVLRQRADVVYVIVGAGIMRAALDQTCQQHGISKQVRFVDWVSHDLMAEFLSMADVVVLPSAHETQALVYLETQACGSVLLASDVPGAREVVEHGVTGMLFRTGDVDDLTAKTLAALADPDLRARIGRLARARVADHAVDRVADAYEVLLRAAVARGYAPPA